MELSIHNGGTSKTPVLPSIQFPKFDGKDFRGWLYKCNQFFQMFQEIPDESKVRLASIHLEGEALGWHRKFMKTKSSELVKWEEYIKEMEIEFNRQMGKSTGKRSESTHSAGKKKLHRLIWRLREIDDDADGDGDKEIKGLNKYHFRFGPIYCNEEDLPVKEGAWQHVLKNTPGRAAATSEKYMSVVRKQEKSARDRYADGVADGFTGSQFRWMMILDGCFFLQLALCVLGGPQQLHYPANHAIFGKNHEKFVDVKEWIEAMFFVGNQIPMVVLKELIKERFFQDVIAKGKWNKPSRLSSQALYELLLLPELIAQSPKIWRAMKVHWAKRFDPITYWMLQQEPNDLLHSLQLLVLGPEPSSTGEEEEEEDEDLEAQHEEGDSRDEQTSSSATELKETGIHFSVSLRIGSRGIHFTNSMFLCHGYPVLHLPQIPVGNDMKMVFQFLRNYEISQNLSMRKREICSYIRFMSELIQMPGDAKLMANNNIITGEPRDRHKLPGILRRLASKDTYDQNIRVVKLKIGEYSPPIWKKYWHIISFGLIVTVLQTVYTILPYYKGG